MVFNGHLGLQLCYHAGADRSQPRAPSPHKEMLSKFIETLVELSLLSFQLLCHSLCFWKEDIGFFSRKSLGGGGKEVDGNPLDFSYMHTHK